MRVIGIGSGCRAPRVAAGRGAPRGRCASGAVVSRTDAPIPPVVAGSRERLRPPRPRMIELIARPWLRRLAADLALWIAVGVVMAILGPFGSSERTLAERLIYWQICMV